MLGMPGFVVLAVSDFDGEVEQAIETTADLVGCPDCGAVAQLHDRRPCWVRDLPAGGRPVTLLWIKRDQAGLRCSQALCPRGTCTETSPWITSRAYRTGPRGDLPSGRRGRPLRRRARVRVRDR
jgi:transposase